MRGYLTNDMWAIIDEKLPRMDTRQIVISLSPSVDTHIYDLINKKKMGSGLVRCNDATNRWIQARYALREAYACNFYFGPDGPEPNQITRHLSTRFYLDYIPILLYSAIEDIAQCIQYVWNIKPDSEKKSSLAIRIGKTLKKTDPQGPLMNCIQPLIESAYIQFVVKYRNDWVHDQPPLIEGLPIQQKATDASPKNSETSVYIGISVVSNNVNKIDDLLEKNSRALEDVKTTIEKIADLIIRERESLGANFDFETSSISVDFSTELTEKELLDELDQLNHK